MKDQGNTTQDLQTSGSPHVPLCRAPPFSHVLAQNAKPPSHREIVDKHKLGPLLKTTQSALSKGRDTNGKRGQLRQEGTGEPTAKPRWRLERDPRRILKQEKDPHGKLGSRQRGLGFRGQPHTLSNRCLLLTARQSCGDARGAWMGRNLQKSSILVRNFLF